MIRQTAYIIAILILAVSCSYLPTRSASSTEIEFELTSLLGTRVMVTANPKDNNTLFYFNVVSAVEYGKLQAEYGDGLAQYLVDEAYGIYTKWLEEVSKGQSYRASWNDFWCFGRGNIKYFVNLTPLTDYVVCGVVLRPGTRKALGGVQTKRFTTTDIQMISKPMQFDFMLDDDPDGFKYYVKPTYKGRICLDPYVSLIVKKDTLDAPPYHGDVKKYALDWYMARKNDIDRYLRCDISRTVVDDIMEQGTRYVLMAAPYNFSEDLNVLKMEFTYRDGMKTGYIPGTK